MELLDKVDQRVVTAELADAMRSTRPLGVVMTAEGIEAIGTEKELIRPDRPLAVNDPVVQSWLASPAPKLVWGTKGILSCLGTQASSVNGLVDVALTAEILRAGLPGEATLPRITGELFGHTLFTEQTRLAAPWLVFHAHKALAGQLAQAGLGDLDRLEQAVLSPVLAMEAHGLPVDLDGFTQSYQARQAHLVQLEAAVKDVLPGLSNWQSAVEVKEVLGKILGVSLPDTSAATLASFDHPAARLLLDLREEKKLLDFHVPDSDGRLRPTWHQIGTATGRSTTENPNTQGIPAPWRKVIAAEPGSVLIAADYERQEIWSLAALSGDKGLTNTLRAGDPYQSLATQASCSRDAAKVVFLATCYGASASGIASRAGLSRNEATRVQSRMAKLWPEAFAYLNASVPRPALDAGSGLCPEGAYEIRTGTALERRRLFAGGVTTQAPDSRAARNAPHQMTGATMAKAALLAAWTWTASESVTPVLFLHDELVFSCPEKIARSVADTVAQAMMRASETVLGPGMVCPPKIGIGKSFADAKRSAEAPPVALQHAAPKPAGRPRISV